MRIAATQYALSSRSLEIYLSGCLGVNGNHCPGCHNPELWSFDKGIPFEEFDWKFLDKSSNMVDNVLIMGGEPTDQPKEDLLRLIRFFKDNGLVVALFTRREIDEIDYEILESIDCLKTGAYDETKKGSFPKTFLLKRSRIFDLSSENQKVFNKGEIEEWLSTRK